MKPALISKNRLKINVTAEDLLRLNISYEMLDYRDLRVRDILNNIIEIACEQTGFNKENEKILVISSSVSSLFWTTPAPNPISEKVIKKVTNTVIIATFP